MDKIINDHVNEKDGNIVDVRGTNYIIHASVKYLKVNVDGEELYIPLNKLVKPDEVKK